MIKHGIHKYLAFVIMLVNCTADKYEGTVDNDPEIDSLNHRAMELVIFGRDSVLAAHSLWDKALTRNPDHQGVLWNKLVYLNELGLFTESNKLYDRLEELTPNDPFIKSGHGAIHEILGDTLAARLKYEQADSLFTKLLNDNSVKPLNQSLIKVNYASNLKLLHRKSEADAILEDILIYDPDPVIIEYVTKQKMMSRNDLLNELRSRGQN